jgi:hypothetical protein
MQEFEKRSCQKLWMPLLTDGEIRGMKAVIDFPISDEELERRMRIVGNIPYHVFQKPDFDYTERAVNGAVHYDFNLGKFIKSYYFYGGEYPEETRDTWTWSWVAHLAGRGKVRWASDYIMNSVLDNQARKDLSKLKDVSRILYVCPPPGDGSPMGFYERWCVFALGGGKELVPLGGEDPIILPVKSPVLMASGEVTLDDLAGDVGCVHYSGTVEHPFHSAAALHRHGKI